MALDSGVPGRDRQVVVGAKSIKNVENVKRKEKISNTPQGSRTLRRGMRIRYVNRYTRGVLILLKSVVMEVADRWRVLFAGRRWVCYAEVEGKMQLPNGQFFPGIQGRGPTWTDAMQTTVSVCRFPVGCPPFLRHRMLPSLLTIPEPPAKLSQRASRRH